MTKRLLPACPPGVTDPLFSVRAKADVLDAGDPVFRTGLAGACGRAHWNR